jgi:hypothetical protein
MNQARLIIWASILGLAFVWASAASAQSRDIEPVEAKVMAKSGETTAAKHGTTVVTRTQQRATTGQDRQRKAMKSDASKQQATQHQARLGGNNGDAQGGTNREKAKRSDGSQSGSGSALRQATRTQERTRTRERTGDRARANGKAELRQADVAEHRQERHGSGASTGATGSASGRGGQS